MIRNAKETAPKFNVIECNKTHFLGCENLLAQFCTNRKKTIQKSAVNWFTFRKIGYRKGHPLQLFFETYDDIFSKYDETIEFKPDLTKTLSVAKRGFNHDNFLKTQLPVLYPNGREISTEKKTDLMELLSFMPVTFHKFYTNLEHCDSERTNDPDETIIISDDSDQE